LTPEDATPTEDALTAIAQADIVVMGPGSLYTSILPNLIIKGLSEAIIASSAYKIYVCNVMTQPGKRMVFPLPIICGSCWNTLVLG